MEYNTSNINYEQSGGEMKVDGKNSSTGPDINLTSQTIKMKIDIEYNTSKNDLPVYLIPELDCGGQNKTTSSKTKVVLYGDMLKQVSSPNIKCEISSDFLTKDTKSAITIETHYFISAATGGSSSFKKNIIYFDESLLKCYKDNKLTIQKNPFLIAHTAASASAPPAAGSPSYTFVFDFHKIIDNINKLSSYQQIQNMFKFVNGIETKTRASACLIRISADAFLNLNFTDVPFDAFSTSSSKTLKLKIETTQTPIATCSLSNVVEGEKDINFKNGLALEYTFKSSALAGSTKTEVEQGQGIVQVSKENEVVLASQAQEAERHNLELKNLAAEFQQKLTILNEKLKQTEQGQVQGQGQGQGQVQGSGDRGQIITGVPGESGSCGSGGIGLTSNGKVVTITLPVKMLMSEIVTPKILEGLGASEDKVKKIVVQSNDVKITQEPVVDDETKAALQKAKEGLTAANQNFDAAKSKLVGLNLTSASPNYIKASEFTDAIDATKIIATTAIVAAETAVNTSSPDATQKVADATAAVLKATQALQTFSDAVDAAAQPAAALVSATQPAAATLDAAETAALAKAKTDLSAERTKLTNAKFTTTIKAITDLETAIKTADDAVTAFEGAADAAKATALNDAKDKIKLLAGLLAPATKAVDAAIAPKPADDPAAQIKALTEKLKKDATDVLDAAQQAYGDITTKPDTPITFTTEEGLIGTANAAIAAANAAIAAATNADAADKAAAIKKASDAVEAAITAAIAAAKKAHDAVAAARKPSPHPPSVADYAAYETAYKAYDVAKKQFESLKASATALQTGGTTPAEQITEAKATLTKAVEAIQIPANIVEINQKAFDALTDKIAKQEKITEVTEATAAYNKIIQEITAATDTYAAAKTIVIAAAKETLDKLINEDAAIKQDIVAEKIKLEGSGDKPTGEALLEIKSRISALELTIASNELEIDKAQREYDAVKENDSQGGGSKQSKSSSSKSSSTPKSKPKNKTKKNHHSAPKSSKSKTPKIIMNE